MEYTRIDGDNIKFFMPFIFDPYPADSEEVLRIGVLKDDNLCGAFSLGFDKDFDSSTIESFYVLPGFRRQGVASDMLAEAEKLAGAAVGCIEAEYESDKAGMDELFDKAGYLRLPGNYLYEYGTDKLLGNKRFQDIVKKSHKEMNIMSFDAMTHGQRNMAFDMVSENGDRFRAHHSRRFSKEFSTGVFSPEGKLIACLLADADKVKKEIKIDYLLSDGGTDYRSILGTICGLAMAVIKAGGPAKYEKVYFAAANPAIPVFFDKLFGEDEKDTVYETSRVMKVIR